MKKEIEISVDKDQFKKSLKNVALFCLIIFVGYYGYSYYSNNIETKSTETNNVVLDKDEQLDKISISKDVEKKEDEKKETTTKKETTNKEITKKKSSSSSSNNNASSNKSSSNTTSKPKKKKKKKKAKQKKPVQKAPAFPGGVYSTRAIAQSVLNNWRAAGGKGGHIESFQYSGKTKYKLVK